MRKLASIQTITALNPIVDADQIEVASILGWKVVVKKGEFKINDLVIYCEIDSLMPEQPEFNFLKPRGMRIRTVRLRGQVSQGICFPLSIIERYGLLPKDMIEGQDVTEAIGIVKYEPPIPANLSGDVKGGFPSFIPKTDETRVQILQSMLNKYKGTACYVTEKLDGSSVTCYIKDGEFGVCSRNLELKETEGNSLWKVARQMDIETKLRSLGINCAIQGEIIGEGIQGNKYKIKGQQIYYFNFFNIDKFKYVGFQEYADIISRLGLISVPVINENYILENDIDALIKMSIDKSILNKDVWREGIVIRPINEITDHVDSNGLLHNDRVSFKAINPEFLIKYE